MASRPEGVAAANLPDLEGNVPKCPICLEPFSRLNIKPKILSCGHSVCEVCEGMTLSDNEINCAVCRKTTRLEPTGNNDRLPTNYALIDMISCASVVPVSASQYVCTPCGADLAADQVLLCATCADMSLCGMCAFKDHKEHEALQITDVAKQNMQQNYNHWQLQAKAGPTHGIMHLPQHWDAHDKFPYLELSHNNLRVTYMGLGNTSDAAAAVRSDHPSPLEYGLYYFEVNIINKGSTGCIGIGLSKKGTNLNRQPGWDPNSFGYHGDDGNSFISSGRGKAYGPTFMTGDVIGCAYNPIHRTIFYTKNGRKLGNVSANVHGELYPTIGLRSMGAIVHANFGQQNFVFNRNKLVEAKAGPTHQIMHLPQHWNDLDKFPYLELSHNNLRVTYIGMGETSDDAAAVRSDHPSPLEYGLYYFEVNIIDKGSTGCIGIGLSKKGTNLNRQLGWDPNSFGYHGDDGNSFISSGRGKAYGPTFTTGDVVGCAYDPIHRTIFFTKNGRHLGKNGATQGVAFSEVDEEELYPTVGLRSVGAIIHANFSQQDFVYDIQT